MRCVFVKKPSDHSGGIGDIHDTKSQGASKNGDGSNLFGKGFSAPTLWSFRQFYEVYFDRCEILYPLGRELTHRKNRDGSNLLTVV